MSVPMTLPNFQKWLEDTADLAKWGWMPEHKRIGRHLKDVTKYHLEHHVGPDGRAWPTLYQKPLPGIGDRAPMVVGAKGRLSFHSARFPSLRSGQPGVITQAIRRGRGKAAARKFRVVYGPPWSDVPALIRTRLFPGAGKARRILDFLTGPGYMGRALRTTRTSLSYGYTAGSRWIEEQHFGDESRKYHVTLPPRNVVGLGRYDVEFVTNVYADGLQKRLAGAMALAG